MNAENAGAAGRPPSAEPVRLYRAEVPPETRHFFNAAPVLAVHDGPWVHSRKPRLGAALKICGWFVAALVLLAVLLDQFRADPFLDDGNKIGAGGVVAVLALILIAGPGAFLSHGRLHHVSSQRRLRDSTETYRGTEATAAAALVALAESDERPVTWRDLSQLARDSRAGGEMCDVIVTTYEAARADYAVATVHLRAKDDEFVIWPPVPISRAVIPGLVVPGQNTTDWTSLS